MNNNEYEYQDNEEEDEHEDEHEDEYKDEYQEEDNQDDDDYQTNSGFYRYPEEEEEEC